MYQGAMLFDLDGTLVDTSADFVAVINHMRQSDGLTPLADAAIRHTVSDGSPALIQLAYGLNEGDAGFAEKRQQLLDQYEAALGFKAVLFQGFTALLSDLEKNNIAWGIVTNKPARFTQPLLAKLNIHPSQHVAICPDHVTHSKPHPEPLLLAAKQLQLTPEQCIYAGDHARDIEAGKNAGMKTITCAYGYIKPNEDIHRWQADYIAYSVNELHQLTHQLFNF